MAPENIVEAFRKRTEECFEKIDGYSASEIEDMAEDYLQERIDEEDIDVEILDVVISGSRCRGLEKEDSDLDIVFEFSSNNWKEDSLFNLIHERDFKIGGVSVDFNPISKVDISGSLEEYLPRVEKYLQEKALKRDQDLLKRVDENICSFGTPFIFSGNIVSFPIEYDDLFSEKELKRLKDLVLDAKKEPNKDSLEEQIHNAGLEKEKLRDNDVVKSQEYSL